MGGKRRKGHVFGIFSFLLILQIRLAEINPSQAEFVFSLILTDN